jgi:hypothetical protein
MSGLGGSGGRAKHQGGGMARFGSRAVRRRRWFGRTLGVATVAALVGLLAPATAHARKPPQSYVALGDSYTAGPVIPFQQKDPAGCLRSDHN